MLTFIVAILHNHFIIANLIPICTSYQAAPVLFSCKYSAQLILRITNLPKKAQKPLGANVDTAILPPATAVLTPS